MTGITKELVDECENDNCQSEIVEGQEVWRKGFGLYCSGRCLAESMGAVTITIN